MSLVVFTGGARSGKSAAAQRLVATRGEGGANVTVVVFGRDRVDAEFADRVARHRAVRPAHWTTIEASQTTGWSEGIAADSIVLVDCVGTALGLAMEEAYESVVSSDLGEAEASCLPDDFEHQTRVRFEPILAWATQRLGDTVVVTNEVGDGVIPAFATGRLFRDLLGGANRLLIERADAAYLTVAGRLVDLGRLPSEASWPAGRPTTGEGRAL